MTSESATLLPKPFVFVLMPFEPAFADIYKFGIKGAADDVGAYAERIDEQLFQEGMLDRIFNQISKADVIVADMTGRNPNVFYEVGYAHALGKIVLLLTQNADDIPFDLKHRQHTVYQGSIDLLRSDLAPKIRWAIGEAQRQRNVGVVERFSVRLGGVEIPVLGGGIPEPVLTFAVKQEAFELQLRLRNEAREMTAAITHVYLFGRSKNLIPIVFRSRSERDPGYFGGPLRRRNVRTHTKIKGFAANAVDAPDGLTLQYRLSVNFPPMPQGTVEVQEVGFLLQDDLLEAREEMRLRLHSASSVHDFPFTLKVVREKQVPNITAAPNS